MIYLVLVICTVLSAICGRAGGISMEASSWIPKVFRRSWVRDWLCPFFSLLPYFIIHHSWWNILAYGALYGSLTTYYDTLFGFDCFWFAGLIAGVAGLFLLEKSSMWIIILRAIILSIGWGYIHYLNGKDNWRDGKEEYVRYGFLAFSTVILLI